MSLDEFTKAYIEAALWATPSCDDEGGVVLEALSDQYCVTDLAPSTLAAMQRDCLQFQKEQAALLAEAYKIYPGRAHVSADGNGYSQQEYAGHDFWLNRNGHGAGFWDRGLGVVGEKLSAACKETGGVYIYVADGLIYQMGDEDYKEKERKCHGQKSG
jgi:hypothetical protein